MHKHKEIFRELYPIIVNNIDDPNWNKIAADMPGMLAKYEGIERRLASDLMLAITEYLQEATKK